MEPSPDEVGVTQGGAQADPSDPLTCKQVETVEEAPQMKPSVTSWKHMEFINHHGHEAGKQSSDGRRSIDEEAFNAFRRDEENPTRLFDEPFPGGLANISMPTMHRDAGGLAQQVTAAELIIDEGL